MANAKIDILGPQDLGLITSLYNDIFQPPREEAYFARRLQDRHNSLIMVAVVDGETVGFCIGYELKPSTFYEWLYGVLPPYRRQGVASQLLDAANAWGQEHKYQITRMECSNRHRPMLHMALARGYEIVGVRWDLDRQTNLVIFEKELENTGYQGGYAPE